MKKRCLALLLVLTMCLLLLPVNAYASPEGAPKSGDGWYIDDNLCLHITGRLSFEDFVRPWDSPYGYYYNSKAITSVVAEPGAAFVGDCSNAFFEASIESVDFRNLNTDEMTDMGSMFHNCYYLASVDLSGINISNETGIEGMFHACYALQEVKADGDLLAYIADEIATPGNNWGGHSENVWRNKATGEFYYDADALRTINGNVTLEKVPRCYITVMYDGNGTASANIGGSVFNIDGTTPAYGGYALQTQSIELTATPNAGYHFKEWQSSEVTVENNTFIMPDTDVTVTAIFEADAPVNYTVNFDMGGHGMQVDPQSVVTGTAAVKPADPSETGWTFDGWYADASYAAAFDFNTAITANTTVYAKWTENAAPQPVNYTVSFNMGGHGAQVDPQSVVAGTAAMKPADPAEAGWSFNGWYTDAAYTTAFDFTAAIAADTTIYAKWTENAAPQPQPPTDPANYEVITGANGEWTEGTEAGLLVTSNAPFSKFVCVKVDGSEIAPENYTAVEGSTKITLKAAYLKTLKLGKHIIEIISTDGRVSTNFTIKGNLTPPPTGDHEPIAFWLVCLALSGAAVMGFTARFGKKQKNN